MACGSVAPLSDILTPGFLDGLILFMMLEFSALAGWLVHRRATRWLGMLFLYLLSGAALVVALRFALAASMARFIAPALLVSLVAHVAFLLACRRCLIHPPSLPDRSLGAILDP